MGYVCTSCGVKNKFYLGKVWWDDKGNYDHEIICTECGHKGHHKGNFSKSQRQNISKKSP